MDEFAAAPKVVKPKNKYKEPEPDEAEEEQIKLIYNNLMWDKRVFRGNTHAALVTLKNVDSTRLNRNNSSQNNASAYRAQQNQSQVDLMDDATSNRRANIQIFTDQFVDNLTDKPPRYQYGSQTLPLPEKAVVRHRIQEKINMNDIETQIWDNELFDFDYEVESLLNVLCGRTLEVSRMQVLQEEELTVMKNRQQELTLEEKAENQKIKGMYEAEQKLKMQNVKKIAQFKKEKEKKIKTHKRLFSRVLAKQFLLTLQPNSTAKVSAHGYFKSDLDNRIANILPQQLFTEAALINQQNSLHLKNAIDLTAIARQSIIKQHQFAKQAQRTRRQEIVFKREELARQKLERKAMKKEQADMRKFENQQRIFLQEEEKKRLAQQEQGGQEDEEKPQEEDQ